LKEAKERFVDLAQLVFDVNTEKLKLAKEAIDALAKSMGTLNKVSAEDAKSAIAAAKAKEAEAKAAVQLAKAKEAETKAALVAAKVNTENVKTSLAQESANRKVVAELEKKAAAEEKATQAAIKSQQTASSSLSVLERQKSILDFMTQGYSKGQSSVLAYAKATGALTDELNQIGVVMQTQRKLQGNDPFDKSMSGLVALKNQYGEIREAMRQYNAESALTRNQTRELTRDKERIIELMKSKEGTTFTDIKNAIKEYNTAYTEQARKVNTLITAEKERERSQRDHANAIRNVQAAEERLFATVSHINDGLSQNANLNERAALAVGSYERNLRLAGITGEAAAAKLQKFKAAQAQITASENKRMGDYIARGVSVQMGDIGVSLASGQNPLIVMIQQMDQIRGLISQAGRDGLDLKNVMNSAFSQIVSSVKEVGIAVGTFLGGAFELVGKKAIFFDTQMQLLEKGRKYVAGITGETSLLTKAFDFAAASIRSLAVVAGATVIATFASVVIAMGQTIKANNEATSSLLQYGAVLGITRDELLATANETAKLGATSNDMKSFFAELIKGGLSSKDSLGVAGKAATEFSSVTGESLSEIAKRYSDLGKDPVKVLTELAKNTGLVSVATLETINSLVKQGNILEANKQAVELYSSALQQLATDQYNALSPLEQLWIQVKIAGGDAWESIVKFANNSMIVDALKGIAISAVAVVAVLREMGQTAISAYSALANPFNISKVWEDYKYQIAIIRKESSDLVDGIIFGKGGVDTTGRQQNAQGAAGYSEAKKAEESLSKFSEKGTKDKKYQEDVKDIVLAYTKAISNAVGDQARMNKLAKDYELAMKGAREERDKGSDRRSQAENEAIATARAALKTRIGDEVAAAKVEETIYANRLKMLEEFNKQSLLSIDDYYSGQKNAVDEWLVTQDKYFKSQIEIYEDAKKKAVLGKDREAIQGKINDLIAKQAENEAKAGAASTEIDVKKLASLEKYRKLQEDINLQVLELNGNLGDSAGAKFDLQNIDAINAANTEHNTVLKEKLKLLRDEAVNKAEGRKSAQETINSLKLEGQIAKENLVTQQKAYDLALKQGVITPEVYRTKTTQNTVASAGLQNQMGNGDANSIALAGIGESLKGFTTLADGIAKSIGTMFSSLTDGIASSMAASIIAGESFGAMMQNLSKNVLQELLSSLIKVGIQWAVVQLLGDDSSKKDEERAEATATNLGVALAAIAAVTIASEMAATAMTTAWTTPATLVSLASFGANGPAAAAGIGEAFAATEAGSAAGKFYDGGYTGAGEKYEPAGTVHKGEIVWSQEDIAKAGGVGIVESMRKGNSGYADGGIVSPSFNSLSMPRSNSQSNSSGVNVKVENYGTSKDFEVEQLSANEIRIIARDEAKNIVRKETPSVVASQIKNPNSSVSKSLNQNTQTQRRR